MKTMIVKVTMAGARDWYHPFVGKLLEVSREVTFLRGKDGTEIPVYNCVKQYSGNTIQVNDCRITGSKYHVADTH